MQGANRKTESLLYLNSVCCGLFLLKSLPYSTVVLQYLIASIYWALGAHSDQPHHKPSLFCLVQAHYSSQTLLLWCATHHHLPAAKRRREKNLRYKLTMQVGPTRTLHLVHRCGIRCRRYRTTAPTRPMVALGLGPPDLYHTSSVAGVVEAKSQRLAT